MKTETTEEEHEKNTSHKNTIIAARNLQLFIEINLGLCHIDRTVGRQTFGRSVVESDFVFSGSVPLPLGT